MLNQAPAVESFNNIGGTPLGDAYTIHCLDRIVAKPPFAYAFILAVYENATGLPVYFVAAEANPGNSEYGGGSHFLSVYDKPGHMTLAVSDVFADANTFFPEAMRLASARFKIPLGKAGG